MLKQEYNNSNDNNPYLLTPMQEGMLFYSIESKSATKYVMQNIFNVTGVINKESFENAINLMAQKHGILRTNLVYKDIPEPMQIIRNNVKIEFEVIDISNLVNAEKHIKLETIVEEDRERGFYLENSLMFRAKLVVINDSNAKLIFCYHHIILDSWSIPILCEDVAAYYLKLQEGADYEDLYNQIINEERKNKKFSDYVAWRGGQDNKEGLKYWANLLSNYNSAAEIRRLSKVNVSDKQIEKCSLRICASDRSKLEDLAEYQKTPVSTILKAAWAVLLSRYNSTKDVVFGNVVSGRDIDLDGVERIAGIFIATYPLRCKMDSALNVKELFKQLYKQEAASNKYNYCSLAQIQSLTTLKGNLLKSIFAFEGEKNTRAFGEDSKILIKAETENRQTNYPISVSAYHQNDNFVIDIVYKPSEYSKKYIELILAQYENILNEFIGNANKLIKDIRCVTQSEQQLILGKFNETERKYDKSLTIIDSFVQQVKKHPEKKAIIFKDEVLTYSELNEKSNQLARFLIKSGVNKGDVVALFAQRSTEMIVGMIGIIKAGAAYAPMDPAFPDSRIKYMLDDCNPKAILKCCVNKYFDITEIDLADEKIWEETKDDVVVDVTVDDLAYVIYTSGTTGEPKGVMVEHRGVINLKYHFIDKYNITHNDIVAQFANIVFDASVWEISMALLNGATLSIVTQEAIKDTKKLTDYFNKTGITVATLPPNYFIQTNNLSLRVLITAGSESSQMILDKACVYRYINAYGPTETTVCATDWEYAPEEREYRVVPIGRPINNTKIYLMNQEYSQLLGIGMIGQICIGGVGVARGYLNKPELTAEKFIDNPFNEGRIYCSGDMGRWLPDGTIEYLGRMDDQVKVNGLRIELGDIESAINSIDFINESAVIAAKDKSGDMTIYSYVVSKKKVDKHKVQVRLSNVLPQYMIPRYIIQVQSIPVTISGKVDKKELLKIQDKNTSEYIEPKTEIEKRLCKVFEQILKVDKVGAKDNFFRLGGDSIKAIRVVSGMRAHGYEVSMKDVMGKYTVEAIGKKVKMMDADRVYCQSESTGVVVTTPIIREFADWNLTEPHHFNQDVMMYLGEYSEGDVKKVLDRLILHHDIIRSVYRDGNLEIVSSKDSTGYDLCSYDIRDVENRKDKIYEICTNLHSSIDLDNGPLLKAAIFKKTDGNYLFLCLHHLIVDSVSWGIITEDIKVGLEQIRDGKEISFPLKTASFITWSKALDEYRYSNQLKSEAKYWKEIAAKMESGKLLVENTEKHSGYDCIEHSIDAETTNDLLTKAGKAFSTEINDLLISAFSLSINRLTRQSSIAIALEGHGREEIHKKIDIDRTVGWFTTIYPVVVECMSDISQSIISVKETLHNVPNHGLGYGLLYDCREMTADIYFNYLGKMNAETENETVYFSSGKRNSDKNEPVGNISFSCIIKKGKLNILVKYKKSFCNKNFVQELITHYCDSLQAIVDFTVNQEFVVNTASDYTAHNLDMDDFAKIKELENESGRLIDIFSLKPVQQGILFECMKNEYSTEYVIQQVFDAGKNTKANLLKKAFALLVKKHEALRTAIVYENVKTPRQVIFDKRKLDFGVIDISGVDEKAQNQKFLQLLSDDVSKGFDFESEPLIRMKLVLLNDNKKKIVLSCHHIIIDGWCQLIIMDELRKFYNMMLQGCDFTDISKLIEEENIDTPNYKEYLQITEDIDNNMGLSYWHELLKDYEESSEIKPMTKPNNCKNQVHTQKMKLSKELSYTLHSLAVFNNLTINSIVEAAWGIVLQKYNMSNDCVFGKSVSGRDVDLENIEDIIGIFINTIPIRIKAEDNTTIAQLIRNVQNQANESIKHSFCSIGDIQNQTQQKNNLINSLLAFEKSPDTGECNIEDGRLDIQLVDAREQTTYDITVISRYEHDVLSFDILYNPNYYKREEIIIVLDKLEMILETFSISWDMKISEIPNICENEKTIITNQFNEKQFHKQDNKTVIDVFEERAAKTPESIAIEFSGKSLSYQEFNIKANQLAWKLRDMGVKQNDFVAIIAHRSVEMLTAIYGILKSGGAYVPIDPTYPEERIQYMLDDCKPKIILTYGYSIDTSTPVLALDGDIICEGKTQNPPKVNCMDDVIYMIYTSGTTGEPKGVANRHLGTANLLYWMYTHYKLNEDDVILFKTTYIFDVSITEILLWAYFGGKIVIAPLDAERDTDVLAQIIEESRVTLINFVPSMLSVFLDYAATRETLKTVRYIFSAGEALKESYSHKFNKIIKNYGYNGQLKNLYGPTEASVYATHFDCEANIEKMMIGKPLCNIQCYIIDKNRLCGIGIPGELCITGDGVALGYLNKPELTNQKFIKNPFGQGMMYLTGDIARYMPNGDIQYIGREDDQVKVRGFRIELGDIESHLRNNKDIIDVVTIIRNKAGSNEICAYVTSSVNLNVENVKNALKKQLPDYMVPSLLIQVPEFPITNNGKLDKKALAKYDYIPNKNIILPRNQIEEELCNIFKEILGLDYVGVTDSFFDLGGHSLKAMSLLNIIKLKFSVNVTLAEIFSATTIEDIAACITGKSITKADVISFAEHKKYYLMSPMQKRIYIVSQLDTDSIAYNTTIAYSLTGDMDSSKVRNVLLEIVKRNEILRTRFSVMKNEFVQIIEDEIKIDFKSYEESEKTYPDLLNEFVKPFSLEEVPLFRVELIKRKSDYLLLLDMHHIISDGMTLANILNEFALLYDGKVLEFPKYQYKDYSEWFKTLNLSDQKEYWIDQFSDNIPVLNLPYDKERPSIQSHRGTIVRKRTGNGLGIRIKELASNTKTTEYMIFLSTLMILLSKLSKQDDIVVGTPVGGRIHKDVEKMIGVFVNTLAIRGRINQNIKFEDFLQEIKDKCVNAYNNQVYPFEELVEELEVTRDLSRNPLFDVMLTQHNESQFSIDIDGHKFCFMDTMSCNAKFDLNFTVMGKENEFDIWIEYCTDLFDEKHVDKMLEIYIDILGQVVFDEQITIKNIETIVSDDRERILNQFNKTKRTYDKNQSVIELIDNEMKRKADKTALVFQDREISYSQLDNLAQKIAAHLAKRSIKKNDLVPIIAEYSIEMIAGILGILKAGGAYVPIDPRYPKDRIDYIVNDVDSKCVLVYNYTKSINADIVDLSDETIYKNKCDFATVKVNSDDLIYCIYTSGTSGNPKGVLIENKSIVNLCTIFISDIYTKHDVKKAALLSSFAFDASVKVLFTSLITGIELHLINEKKKEQIDELVQYIYINDIDAIDCTPSYLNLLCSTMSHYGKCDSTKVILSGGEELKSDVINNVYKLERISIYNVYGPTEAAVDALVYACNGNEKNKVPIGKPIKNVNVYILENINLCGITVPGELCIAGDGVGRGYLNNPQLTSEKFVDNPFGEGRMYRTGDLARWLPDGNIEYLGRIDNQVKVRGFRIELGEIESVLRSVDTILDAAVIVKKNKDGISRIYAYVSSKTNIDINYINICLRAKLPEYMVPEQIIQIDSIPMTVNGKLDTKALMNIEMKKVKEYVKPRNEVEEVLCNIFEEVLNKKDISITDSFFEIGGDSIAAIRISSKIRRKNYNITVRDIMSQYTIENIASIVDQNHVYYKHDQGDAAGNVINTPMISYFNKRKLPNKNHFCQDILFEPYGLDEREAEQALLAIIKHHDVLRATYDESKLTLVTMDDWDKFDFTVYDYSKTEFSESIADEDCKKIQESFDIESGPLIKAAYFKFKEKNYMFICIHHLVVDGVSWRIIIDDFIIAAQQIKSNDMINLPSKTASFIEWSTVLDTYSESDVVQGEKTYWDQIIHRFDEGRLNTLENSESGIGKVRIELDENQTERLIEASGRSASTKITSILLSAIGMSVKMLTNQNILTIGMEGHGREEISNNIVVDRTVGWFTTKYPISLDLFDNIEECISSTDETIESIPQNGIGYGLLYPDMMDCGADFIFNYLGQLKADEIQFCSIGTSIAIDNGISGIVDMDGIIHHNRLVFDVRFDRSRVTDNFIYKFIQYYQANLNEIISYVLKKNSGKALSEFKATGIAQAELEMLEKINDIEAVYPITSLQEGILYFNIDDRSSTKYVIQEVFDMDKEANSHNLELAVKLVVQKYDILRSGFADENMSKPVRVVYKNADLEFVTEDLSKMSKAESEKKFELLKEKDIERGFDLTCDLPIRVKYVILPECEHKLIFSHHHIVLDGWSIPIVISDIEKYYSRLNKGDSYYDITKGCEFSNVLDYKDYICAVNLRNKNEAEDYWSGLLSDFDSESSISPTKNSISKSSKISREQNVLSKELSAKISNTAVENNVTISTMFESAWGYLLQQYNYIKDVVFGKVVSGRNIELDGIEEAVGCFINTIPVRVKCPMGMKVSDLLQDIRKQGTNSIHYSFSSLAEIQKLTPKKSDLIKTIYVYENYYINHGDNYVENDLKLDIVSAREETNYDITLCVYYDENISKYYISIIYDQYKFDKNSITLILERYEKILSKMINASIQVNDIETTLPKDRKLFKEINDNHSQYPRNKSIAQIFQEQVEKTPDNIAVVHGDEYLTYKGLDIKANQLAWTLISKGVTQHDMVAVIGRKKVDMLVGICGVIKVGCAYIPIDPSMPKKRINYIIKDAAPAAIIAYRMDEDLFDSDKQIPVVILDDANSYNQDTSLPMVNGSAEDIAYLMYTSGTTGKPKGTVIYNRNVSRLVINTNYVKFSEDSKVLMAGTLAFDASTLEIWGPLLNGGTLVVADKDTILKDNELKKTITTHSVTHMFLTTALFNYFVQEDAKIFEGMQCLLTGGDKISEKHVKLLRESNPEIKLVNGYGPTENCTFTTCYQIEEQLDEIPIGVPISNTQVYILNNAKLCGIGIPGELCTSGDGLGGGYLNQPELTEEKFVDNPFGYGKLYRTGDLARIMPDGNIKFIGRIDEQVKIRGFRIELSEIESVLKNINGIDDAAGIVREDAAGDKAIYAYITSKAPQDIGKIKDELRELLPDYMIPPYMMQISSIPITRNGKVDRIALPEIASKTEDYYIAPRNESEEIVCNAFGEVLNAKKVGMRDNFYLLGGDSIKAIRIVSKARAKGCNITVKDIMSKFTVETIARAAKLCTSENSYLQSAVSGKVKPTPILIKFAEWNLKKPWHFNQDVLVNISKTDACCVEQALDAVVSHHDILRAVYIDNQLIIREPSHEKAYDFYKYEIPLNNADEFIKEKCSSLHAGIDLENGPLVKAAMFSRNDDYRLFIAIHHLLVDGISWRIILEDLRTALDMTIDKKDVVFPKKTASFIDWANALEEYKSSKKVSDMYKYWDSIADASRLGRLKIAKNGDGKGYETLDIEFDSILTYNLLYKAPKAFYTRINELLIAAISRAVGQLTHQNEISINMEGHGREEIYPKVDIERTVGWFTTTYPVVLKIKDDILGNIVECKETLRKIPNNGIEYGLLMDNLSPVTADITFNYLGEFVSLKSKDIIFNRTGKSVSEDNRLISGIAMNGSVIDGMLKFSLTYDAGVYARINIKEFAELYYNCLVEIVEFCSKSKKSMRTISDAYAVNLSTEDLDVINNLF